MATKYCDHGAYGAYAAIPTWGAAQDGDGTAIGVGTPSTAEIVFTGIASTGVISVLGQAITFTRVTDANTCANNLATAINASTAVATGPASFTTLSQVRNHLYARGPANGAPAGTCQIMTRQASASHAGLIAVTHTLNNVSSPATVNFAGGTGGCWGWLFNPTATIWPSAAAAMTYGIWSTAKTFAGSMNAGDVVEIRAGKTFNWSGANTITINIPAVGSASQPVVFNIDDSTLWSDGVNPVLRLTHNPADLFSISINPNGSAHAHILAKKYTDGTRNLIVECITTSGTSGSVSIQIGSNVLFENVLIAAPGTRAQSRITAGLGSSNNFMTGNTVSRFKDCKFIWPGQQTNLVSMSNGGYNYRAEMTSCEFFATDAASAATSIISIHSNNTHRLTLDSCKFTGFVSGSRLIAASTSVTGECAVFAKNCDMGNVNALGPNFMSSAVGEFDAGMRGLFITSQYGTRDFVYERAGRIYVEWVASKGRPTLNAKLHDAITSWSIFAVPSNTTNALGPVSPSELPRIAKIIPSNDLLAEGVRTFTVNFLIDSNLAWTKRDISVLLSYQMPDGTVRVFDSYDPNAEALSTSIAAWSATSWNSQAWLKKEFSITTPFAVKSGSEVGIYVRLHTTSANETWGIILDPEVVVA